MKHGERTHTHTELKMNLLLMMKTKTLIESPSTISPFLVVTLDFSGVVPFAQRGEYSMGVEEISNERIRRCFHDDDGDFGEDGHSE